MKNLEELILNLTTIGRLREGDKLSVYYGRFYITPHGYFRSIRRYFNGQNRNDTIDYISTTINYSLVYARSLINNCKREEGVYDLSNLNINERQELISLYNTLKNCVTGLNELGNSYSDDRSTLSLLDVIRTNVETFLNDANETCLDNISRQKTHYTNAL